MLKSILSQQKKFEKLLRELNLQSSLVPGYTEVILTVMQAPLRKKIHLLERILYLIKSYPQLKILGVPHFGTYFSVKGQFVCEDCEKEVEEEEALTLNSDDSWNFQCSDCRDADERNNFNDYDREEDEVKLEEKVSIPLTDKKRKSTS